MGESSFAFEITAGEIDDLRDRLRRTRWPEREAVADWSQGVPLAWLRDMCAYWADGYDFAAAAQRINAFPQFRRPVDGLGIHYLQARSPAPGALPLVMTHGWPGSVVEFLKVIGPLSDPRAHGGDPDDAFHVVCPSLPGYAFSDKPDATGWGLERIARAWGTLMGELGYDSYVAQGGDWGAGVTAAIGAHLNIDAIKTTGPSAFAQWGGSFWFFTAPIGTSSRIDRYDPIAKTISTINASVGFEIVAAGVSTCAPTK